MEFRVIIEMDRAARPALAARTADFARGRDKETRFWDSFRAAKARDGVRKPEAAPSAANPETLAASVADIHVQLRTRLPNLIHSELIERLALRLGTTRETVDSRRADVSDASAIPDDKAAALAALRIEIGGIRGGSLELLVIAFGFAKLATLAGITGTEFAEYLKIVTPVALRHERPSSGQREACRRQGCARADQRRRRGTSDSKPSDPGFALHRRGRADMRRTVAVDKRI
jgi:hypothetical protein